MVDVKKTATCLWAATKARTDELRTRLLSESDPRMTKLLLEYIADLEDVALEMDSLLREEVEDGSII